MIAIAMLQQEREKQSLSVLTVSLFSLKAHVCVLVALPPFFLLLTRLLYLLLVTRTKILTVYLKFQSRLEENTKTN